MPNTVISFPINEKGNNTLTRTTDLFKIENILDFQKVCGIIETEKDVADFVTYMKNKDILIEIANIQLLDHDIIIYFGYQAKSIAEGLLNLKGIKYPILWPQRNLDEIIGEYYESRLSYGEKFLEDQSEDIS